MQRRKKDTKLRLLKGWGLAAGRTSDRVREHGGKECFQTLNVPGTHLSWKYTELWFLLFPCFSNSCSQLSLGSFMEKQSFQTLAFPYNFHPGYIPGSALSRLHLFPCLVSVSPLSYPLLCSAMGALEPAVSFLLMEDQCVAMARSVWMCLALQHWSVALWIQTRCVWCSHSCLQRKKMQHESGQTINYYFHCLSERSKIQIFC